MSLKAIRILAFIIWMPALISLLAFSLGMLKLEYMIAINLTVIIAEMILLIMSIRRITKYSRIITGSVIIPKSKLIHKYITANSEILSENVKPIHPCRNGIFRVIMELVDDKENKPLKFYIIRKCNLDTCEQEINIVEPCKIGRHIFEIGIDPKEMINFKFDRDTTIRSFSVDELYIP